MRAVASLKIYTLMCCFWQKYIMLGVLFHNTEEWYKIWGGTNLCLKKWHEEPGEFWRNTWNSQNLHLNGLLLTKVYNAWLKNYWGVMCHDTERWYNIQRKIDCWFEKSNNESCQFWCEQLLVWKCELWWACFVPSLSSFRWKSTEELYLMKLKSDPKKS